MRAAAAPAGAADWVTRRTGARVDGGEGVVALALRRNPRRSHLLVSSLLGKHVPVPAAGVLSAGEALGGLVAGVLGGVTAAPAPVVVGFAETATALGHAVATGLGARGRAPAVYLHTTRRPLPALLPAVAFAEEHSHAVDQALAVADPRPVEDPDAPLVLVDDELSTGRTALNAVRALHAVWPRRWYVLASLLDTRGPEDAAALRAAVDALGAAVDSVALHRAGVVLPADLPTLAAQLAAGHPAPVPPAPAGGTPPHTRWTVELPAGVPASAAAGWGAADDSGLRAAAAEAARALRPVLPDRTLVLGDEEFMYAGQLVAAALGGRARTSTTTRSPAVVVDEPGYPLRTALAFPATDGTGRPAYAYNVPASRRDVDPGPAPGFDAVVLVTDTDPAAATGPGGLLQALGAAAPGGVHVVRVRPGTAGTPTVRSEGAG